MQQASTHPILRADVRDGPLNAFPMLIDWWSAAGPVRLKVDGRARRVSLRVDRARSEVVALAPSPRRLNEAVAFAHEKSAWIAKPAGRPAGQRHQRRARWHAAPVRSFPIGLRWGPAGRAKIDGDRLDRARRRQLGPEDSCAWPSATPCRVLTERTADPRRRPEPPHAFSVAVADPKARWGSCRPATSRNPGGDPLQLAPDPGPGGSGRLCRQPTNAPTWSRPITARASGRCASNWSATRRPTAPGCAPTQRNCTRSELEASKATGPPAAARRPAPRRRGLRARAAYSSGRRWDRPARRAAAR